MEQLKILAIAGSLRSQSYNRQLANLAKAAIGERAEFELLSMRTYPC